MKVSSLGFQTDLALLTLGGSVIEDEGDHLVVRSPHNPTHWWGNFLLVAEVPREDAAPLWLDRFAEVFPDATYLALGFDAPEGRVDDLDGFAALGYRAEAQAVMTATAVHAPSRQHPTAVNRRLVSDDDWAQSVELRVACIDEGLDPAGYRIFAERRGATMRALVALGHGGWFGAFVDGRLVSQMGLIKAGSQLARFQSVETDPGFRRQGLAGSLVHHVSRVGFDEFGASTLVMVADPDYFAIDLYRAVGFEVTEAQLQVERRPTG